MLEMVTVHDYERLEELRVLAMTNREEIFRILLCKKPLADDVSLPELAEMTDGMTGGDIALMCRRAAINALKDDAEHFMLSRRHLVKEKSNA